MKSIFQIVTLSLLLIVTTQCKKEKPELHYDRKYIKEIKDARNDIFFFMKQNVVPGATFAILKEGKIIYSEGLGVASKDLNVPITGDSKFRIGQLSELFTSAIYQKMVENSILNPDSTIQNYYPEFPNREFSITLQNLIDHTSGIRPPTKDEQDNHNINPTIEKGIDYILNDSVFLKPGDYQIPSMFNYNLIGLIMEIVEKRSFADILKSYITDTLKLHNTMIDNPFITIKGRTDFFVQDFMFQTLNATSRDMRYKAPSEGLLSNADDLVKFGNSLLSNSYFSEDLKKNIFNPVVLNNGEISTLSHGWRLIKDHKGRIIYGRSGTVTGGSAALLIYPEIELVIACTLNIEITGDDYPLFEIARHFLADD